MSEAAATIETVSHTAKATTKRYLKLHVNNNDRTNANVQFTWCLTAEGTRMLRERRVFHPFLLINVARRNPSGEINLIEFHREIYPLDQGMALLQFRRPDTYLVFATIIWAEDNGKPLSSRNDSLAVVSSVFERTWMRNNGFRFDLTEPGREELVYNALRAVGISSIEQTERFDVMIDESLFAPEPVGWVWKWANLHFSAKPENSCNFRKRLIYAFSLGAVLELLFLMLKVVFGLGDACYQLLRGIRPTALTLAPIISARGDLFSTLREDKKRHASWVEEDRDGKARHWLFRELMPPWRILLAALYTWSVMHYLSPLKSSIVLTLTAVAVSVWLRHIKQKKHTPVDQEQEQAQVRIREARVREKEDAILRETYAKRYEPLVCEPNEPDTVVPSVEALPPSHRTLHVRFLDAKTKMCLPFRG